MTASKKSPWLACFLFVSVCGNAALVAYLSNADQKLRVDPFELEHYVPARPPKLTAAGVRRIVFFGDSRARSWPEPRPIAGAAFENRGIGYQSSTQALGRLEEDVLSLQPSVLVLQLGINDVKANAKDSAQRARFIQRCKTNITTIVQRSVAAGIHVVLLTIFPIAPVPWYSRLFTASDTRRAVDDVNVYLRRLASAQVTIFESDDVLADDQGWLRGQFKRDYLHVNDAGYEALDSALHPVLQSLRQLSAAGRD